jgi:hypothetical protein
MTFSVLFFLVGGIVIGAIFHKRTWLASVSGKLSMVAIYLLLFALGLKAGSNKVILTHLSSLGLTALMISLFAVTGSVFVAWMVYRYVFKDMNNEE